MATPIQGSVRYTQEEEDDDRFNMILIGETGSGKTSLIELFKNYEVQYGQYFDVKKVQPFVKPNVVGKTTRDQAERKLMASDTKESKSYYLQFGDFRMEIIDTPGLADTKGKEVDEINIGNIITKIREAKRIHCICLVINGTICRFNPSMKTVIEQISKIMPWSYLANIIIFFTQTSDLLNLTFEKEVFKTIWKWNLNEKQYFYIQNPYARWLRAKEIRTANPQASSEFAEGTKIIDDMISKIRNFQPIMTIYFGEFRQLSDEINKDISNISICYSNIAAKDNARKELEKCANTMQGKLEKMRNHTVEHKQVEIHATKDRNVICTRPDCYQNCHMSCKCRFTGVILRRLHRCQCFESSICTNCNHSATVHGKSKYMYITRTFSVRLFKDDDGEVDDEGIQSTLRMYEKDITEQESQKTCYSLNLFANLEKFQSLASGFFLNKSAMEEIEDMKHQVDSIPDPTFCERVLELLEDTQKVLKDPYTKDPSLIETKIRWACGMLHLDKTTVSEEHIISTQYGELTKFTRVEASNSVTTYSAAHLLEHAKDLLQSIPLKQIKGMFNKKRGNNP